MFNVSIEFTSTMDDAVRDAYLNYTPGSIRKLAEELNVDHGVIRRRANKLGLPKIRQNRYSVGYRRWTGPEVRLLLENESLNIRQLETIFHRHGFIRSSGAIDCFRRLHHSWLAKHHQDEFAQGYSTFQIHGLLGVDHSTVLRWIKKGLIKAHQPSCENWRIRREDLLRFLLEHPSRFDCKNVDTYWLMDLVQDHMRFKSKPKHKDTKDTNETMPNVS